MLTRWENGRAEIDRLIAQGRLSKVAANRDLADSYLQAARSHVLSATVLSGSDPEGAFQLAYDAARKALAAILVNQGLRAGGQGAHLTIYEAVRAQLDPPKGKEIRLFDWMRRLRNSTSIPTQATRLLTLTTSATRYRSRGRSSNWPKAYSTSCPCTEPVVQSARVTVHPAPVTSDRVRPTTDCSLQAVAVVVAVLSTVSRGARSGGTDRANAGALGILVISCAIRASRLARSAQSAHRAARR